MACAARVRLRSRQARVIAMHGDGDPGEQVEVPLDQPAQLPEELSRMARERELLANARERTADERERRADEREGTAERRELKRQARRPGPAASAGGRRERAGADQKGDSRRGARGGS